MTPNIGRRFTIEPKPDRSGAGRAKQSNSQQVSNVPGRLFERHTDSGSISGIRLFPGNALVLSRKYGCSHNQVASGLATQDLTFTVTERGLEPEAFVRVVFRCPMGVFVQTARGDEDEGAVKRPTSSHQSYQLDREVGQAVIIRPRVPFEDAALDIENQGIFIQHWFDAERGRVSLQVCVTDAWQVLSSENRSTQSNQDSGAVDLDESSREFLAAFMKASEHYLDRDEYDLLKSHAWALVKGPHQR